MEAARIGSRKQVKKLFKSQQIVIDGQPAQSLSQIVDPELQTIQVSVPLCGSDSGKISGRHQIAAKLFTGLRVGLLREEVDDLIIF